jgi:2-phosphosulfolactate phosphatase
MLTQNVINVCFSPALFHLYKDENSIIVIVDILRATSAICTAFDRGAEKIIPVASIDEARKYKEKGYLVAAERDGVVLDFADFGNSPDNFTVERVKGKTIVYSTTNGTQAIQLAQGCYKIVIGAYLNHKILCEWLITQNKNVVVLCAGWKDRFSLEDSVYAGAMTDNLIRNGNFSTTCDSALASIDLWNYAKINVLEYIRKAAHRTRLEKLKLDNVIEYCHTFNLSDSLPVLENDYLINLNKVRQS